MRTTYQIPQALPSFKKIQLSLCKSSEDSESLFNKRYECYLKANAISTNRSQTMSDHYDKQENCYNQAAYYDGRLIGGIRGVKHQARFAASVPAMETYGCEIKREIGLNDPFLESCRFVLDDTLGRSPVPSIALIRSNIIAALALGSKHIITAARMKHVPFYERIGMQLVSSTKVYPGLHVEMALLIGFDIQSSKYAFIEKYISQGEIEAYSSVLQQQRSLVGV